MMVMTPLQYEQNTLQSEIRRKQQQKKSLVGRVAGTAGPPMPVFGLFN